MGFLDILKGGKKDENVPPDVGQEEPELEKVSDGSEVGTGIDEEETPSKSAKKVPEKKPEKVIKETPEIQPFEKKSSAKPLSVKPSTSLAESIQSEKTNLELEKVGARIEALEAWIKGYSERFSNINQQMGEIRAMNLANEKAIAQSSKESSIAVDIVKEVKPEKLRVDFQKVNMKADTVAEKLEANKQFYDELMNEINNLKRKEKIFMGTDALLKLNDDVKKDLIEIQKTSGRVKMQADKSEQIFIELRKGFAENQKSNEIISNLEVSYSGLKSEVERLRMDHGNVISKSDFNDFQKKFYNKFSAVENYFPIFDKLKTENEQLANLIEKAVSISKENKDDIAEVALSVGNDKIKSVSDYDDKLVSILTIVDSLAGQVALIKKKIGIKPLEKVFVEPNAKKVIGKKNLNMEHVKVHPEVSRPLVSKPAQVSVPIKKVVEKQVPVEEKKVVVKKQVPVVKKPAPVLQGSADVRRGVIGKLYDKISGKEKSIVKTNSKIKQMVGEFDTLHKKETGDLEEKKMVAKSGVVKKIAKKSLVKKNDLGKKKTGKVKPTEKKVIPKVQKKYIAKPEKKKIVKPIIKKVRSKKSEAKLRKLRLKNLKKARKAKVEKRKMLLKNLKKARRVLKEKRKKKDEERRT